jgi:hypothetical protein
VWRQFSKYNPSLLLFLDTGLSHRVATIPLLTSTSFYKPFLFRTFSNKSLRYYCRISCELHCPRLEFNHILPRNPPGNALQTVRRLPAKYIPPTSTNMSQSSSGSRTSRPSPPGGSQTNWNEVFRYSSPIGVVKSDIVYGVYNTSSSQGGQGSSSSPPSHGSGSNRPR